MRILIVLLLLPLSLLGQTAPKGATKIIVSNELSAKENFAHAVSVLLDNGYFFDSRDSTIGYIKTQTKKINKNGGSYFLNVRAMDKKIEISGMWKVGFEVTLYGVSSGDEFEPIVNRGSIRSYFKDSFDHMDLISGKITGTRVYN